MAKVTNQVKKPNSFLTVAVSAHHEDAHDNSAFNVGVLHTEIHRLTQLHEAGLEQLDLWKADDRATNIPKLQAAISEIAWAIASLQAAQKQLSSFLKHQRAF